MYGSSTDLQEDIQDLSEHEISNSGVVGPDNRDSIVKKFSDCIFDIPQDSCAEG